MRFFTYIGWNLTLKRMQYLKVVYHINRDRAYDNLYRIGNKYKSVTNELTIQMDRLEWRYK